MSRQTQVQTRQLRARFLQALPTMGGAPVPARTAGHAGSTRAGTAAPVAAGKAHTTKPVVHEDLRPATAAISTTLTPHHEKAAS